MPRQHKLARKAEITPEDLTSLPFVPTWRASLTYRAIREVFADSGVELKIAAETEFFASACAIVAAGGGATIVDPLTAASISSRAIAIKPFAPMVPYEICVFHRRSLSLLGEAFMERLDAQLAAHVVENA